MKMLYPDALAAEGRYEALRQKVRTLCPGAAVRCFSAPGRTELGGNHTDHQRGHVLAAAVNLDMAAAAALNGTTVIRIHSQGFETITVDLDCLIPVEAERNTSAALVRGMAAAFIRRDCPVTGFTACISSDVPKGSGLSSSAAFEVLVGTIINELFFDGQATPAQIAQMGQQAENVFFGKPCGLMDQMASSCGGVVGIDFGDPALPAVEQVNFDLRQAGYALCIIDSGADHADLTGEYAAIPHELGDVASFFGVSTVLGITPEQLAERFAEVRQRAGDRAVLRTLHVLREDVRAREQTEALLHGDVPAFLHLVRQSGQSSWMYLQNVTPAGQVRHQSVAAALALCDLLLGDEGAFRVHGGGFAGTVQAIVPSSRAADFRRRVEAALGGGTCHMLSFRAAGGTEVLV